MKQILPDFFLKGKALLILLLCIVVYKQVAGQEYIPIDKDSKIIAIIKNVGMNVEASFTGIEGHIHFTPSDLKACSFEVSADAASVNTGIDVRDENLKTDEYLAVKKFPRISILSKQLSKEIDPGVYLFKGVLTIRGMSKEISFPFKAVQNEAGWTFTGEFKINRSDFKIAPGSEVLSNAITVSLLVNAQKK